MHTPLDTRGPSPITSKQSDSSGTIRHSESVRPARPRAWRPNAVVAGCVLATSLVVASLCTLVGTSARAEAVDSRNVQDLGRVSAGVPVPQNLGLQTPAPTGRIVVKFHEESGLTISTRGIESAVDVTGSALAAERVQSLLDREAPSFDLGRHFSRPVGELDEERREAEAKSGLDLADLNTYARLSPHAGWTPAELHEILVALLADPAVETAFLEPVAVPAAVGFDAFTGATPSYDFGGGFEPATPNYTNSQGYLDPAPTGVDAEGAWLISGGRGANVKVVDIEGAWLWSHEDLPSPFFTAGGEILSQSWRDHGTAVLGEIRGAVNSFGVTGIAAEVQVGGCSISELSVADAINTASSALSPGDIFLIELHAPGPNANGSGQFGYVCMEFWQDNFDAIQIATALGRICCEAAGNGEQDFDEPIYGDLFDRDFRDSGAIMCGATDGGNLDPAWFTNYGARVDLHGWGANVVTCAYGDLQGGSETQWYTSFFSGTSSASPIVVGAVASLQGLVKANLGSTLDAALARELLVSTGTPQVGTKHIGPRPNITAAWAVAQNGIGTVSGTVTESGVGSPLEGIEVTLLEAGSRASTNAAGQFSFPLLSGSYTAVYSSPFFQTTQVPFTISAGGTATADAALLRRPTVDLVGVVRSAETGIPLSGVRVTPEKPWLSETVTGAGGSWLIPDAPEGHTYFAGFDGLPGYGAEYGSVDVPEGFGSTSANLDVQIPTVDIDFESSNGSFTTSSLWSWGVPSAGGPAGGFGDSRCWGVGMTGDYPDNAGGTLTSPTFDFSGESELKLSFHYWAETEVCYDGVNVEVFAGGSWQVIEPLAGYQCAYLGGLDYEDGWTGSTGDWVGATFDLAPYIGSSVRFRFVFGSDGGVNGQGFWIDSIAFDTGDAVTAVDETSFVASSSVRLGASPIPFGENVTLHLDLPAAAAARIDVYDATGREVRGLFRGPLASGSHDIGWDGRNDDGLELPDGVYFARVTVDGAQKASRRLVLTR